MRHALRRRACRGSTALQRSTGSTGIQVYSGLQSTAVYNPPPDADGRGRTDGRTDGRTGQTGPIGIWAKIKTGGVTLILHQTTASASGFLRTRYGGTTPYVHFYISIRTFLPHCVLGSILRKTPTARRLRALCGKEKN